MKNTGSQGETPVNLERSRSENETPGFIAKANNEENREVEANNEAEQNDLAEAADLALTEDLALALLARNTLSVEALEELSQNANLSNSRKVRVALVLHPHTPRRISLKLLRQLHTFDLMRLALLPALSGDLKRSAAELLVARLPSITVGERISLARRAPEAVAAALLSDKELRVLQAALENPRLTEAAIVKVLARPAATAALVQRLCRHDKWSRRHEIRMALLRHPETPLARALEFAHSMPAAQVRDILHGSPLSEKVKTYLQRELELKR